MVLPDVLLYLERARDDLKAAQSNLEHGLYAVAVT
jgi:HEPN domain-containing protein